MSRKVVVTGVGIVSPESNAPAVRLAIKEVCEDGWHMLTSIFS